MRFSGLISLVLIGLPATAVAQGHSSANLKAVDDVVTAMRSIEAWQVDEARTVATKLWNQRSDDPLVQALVGNVKMHLGDYTGAVDLFRQAQRNGAPEQVLYNLSVAEAARVATDGYAEAVGDHFLVRYTPGRDEILVHYTMETLEKARARIGELLGWQPEGRVVVEIYPSASTLAAVSTLTKDEIANSGTIALCRWNRLMITTPRAVAFGYSWRDTLSHELTHLIIGGASKNTVPIWLHEGIAKYAETAWRGEPGLGISVEQQERLRTAAQKGKLIPFEKMHPSMAKLSTQEETSLAFSEVFTFIEYLIAQKGWEGIRQTLRHMSKGASDEDAIELVFGESLKSLSKKWMRTLATRPIKSGAKMDHEVVLKDRPELPDDKLHGLSEEGRRLARAADLLFTRGRMKAAQTELDKAYEVTKSPVISAKLAMVALANRDLETAERASRVAIDTAPDRAGPNVTLAEILVMREKMTEARERLERAIDINPFDPRIHELLTVVNANDPERRAMATATLQRLAAGRPQPRSLGQGGLIEVEGAPFSRVYLRRAGGSDALFATGLTTPTTPFPAAPGKYELVLVPAFGPSTSQIIEVLGTGADGTPQRILAGTTGS